MQVDNEKLSSHAEDGETQRVASNRAGKYAKLFKQEGVDEEADSEVEKSTVQTDLMVSDSSVRRVEVSAAVIDNVQPKKTTTKKHRVNVGVSTKPKNLIRSRAFSGDDDSGISPKQTPTLRLLASRSTFSSTSFDSGHDQYTDSTGVNLLSFIVCTLHKNAKDRHMLLQLEDHMIKLISDPMRNSEKFPAMSSYNRMLVHRVAAFFGLDHNVDQNGTSVVVNKTSHTRLPEVEFAALIQGDVYTDEPRRFLRRDAQSYEEGRQTLNTCVVGRRARSFEVGECLTVGDPALNVGCAFSPAPLHIHSFHQQGSTSSTDASSTHPLESPGSCYSYGDMPFVGVYSPSEGNTSLHTSLSNTAQMFAWSSSESYGSSVEFQPTVISSVLHTRSRAPLLTRGVSIDAAVPPSKTPTTLSHNEQHMPIVRRGNTDWHRVDAAPTREPSIPEHATMIVSEVETVDYPAVRIHQQAMYTGTSVAELLPNRFIANPAPEPAAYAIAPSLVQYAAPTQPALYQQKLTEQMDSLSLADYPEAVAASQQPYLMPAQSAQVVYSHQYLMPSQVASVYSPQQCFIPVVSPNSVRSSTMPPYAVDTELLLPNYTCAMQPAETVVCRNDMACRGSAEDL